MDIFWILLWTLICIGRSVAEKDICTDSCTKYEAQQKQLEANLSDFRELFDAIKKENEVLKEHLDQLRLKYEELDDKGKRRERRLNAIRGYPISECTWGPWTLWSKCSSACGSGTMSRRRSTRDRAEAANICTGQSLQSQSCLGRSCLREERVWSHWSAWSGCSVSCGTGTQGRFRICDGRLELSNSCHGVSKQVQRCKETCTEKIKLSWSAWTSWTKCSATCGKGSRDRWRKCIGTGEECKGLPVRLDSRACTGDPCPTDPQWSAYSDWSECTTTCGKGTMVKTRTCSAYGLCYGSSELVTRCYKGDCPGELSTKCAVRHEGKCFILSDALMKMPRKKHQELCDAYGGQLANIYSKEHFDKMRTYILSLRLSHSSHLWTGMQHTQQANITYRNGSKAEFVVWAKPFGFAFHPSVRAPGGIAFVTMPDPATQRSRVEYPRTQTKSGYRVANPNIPYQHSICEFKTAEG